MVAGREKNGYGKVRGEERKEAREGDGKNEIGREELQAAYS